MGIRNIDQFEYNGGIGHIRDPRILDYEEIGCVRDI
jgi:hypothetical protein